MDELAPLFSTALGLDGLRPGEWGVVRTVEAQGSARLRLFEMGFVAGARVRLVRRAPLSDPLEVELHGYHLTLRRSEARLIRIERSDGGAPAAADRLGGHAQ